MPVDQRDAWLRAYLEYVLIPATGRTAKWTVIIIGRFEGEKLEEDWVEYDRYNLFRQLGAL